MKSEGSTFELALLNGLIEIIDKRTQNRSLIVRTKSCPLVVLDHLQHRTRFMRNLTFFQ